MKVLPLQVCPVRPVPNPQFPRVLCGGKAKSVSDPTTGRKTENDFHNVGNNNVDMGGRPRFVYLKNNMWHLHGGG